MIIIKNPLGAHYGENFHNPLINRAGYLMEDRGETIKVRAVDGVHVWNKKDIEFIDNEEPENDL